MNLFARTGIRKPLARRLRPQLESLTDRITPAVTASMVGSVLTIKAVGADADDHLNVHPNSQVPGQLRLESSNGGSINGTAGGTFDAPGVTAIKCDLGEGDDALDIASVNLTGGISFRGGNGANTFALSNSTVGGSVSVSNLTNTTGSDATNILVSTVEGNFIVNNGLGSTTGVLKDLTVRGNLNYTTKSSALIPGDDSIEAELLTVDRHMALALGNGTNALTGLLHPERIQIGSSFKYTGGSGKDTLDFRAGALIGTSATITLGENDNKVMADQSNGLTVGTKLKVTAGASVDTITLTSSILSRVTGAASFNLGDGANTFTTSRLRAGSLSLTTGADADTGTFDNLTVDSATTLKFGAGVNTVKLASTGASSGASTIGTTLTLTTGADADAIQVGFNGAVSVGEAAKFTLGTGAAGNGNDGLTICNAQFASSLSIIGGAGSDGLHIGDLYTVSITGKLTVNAGAGNDQLVLGMFGDPTKFVHLTRLPTLIGGGGDGDVLKIFPQAGGGNVQGPPGVTVVPSGTALLAAGWEGLV